MGGNSLVMKWLVMGILLSLCFSSINSMVAGYDYNLVNDDGFNSMVKKYEFFYFNNFLLNSSRFINSYDLKSYNSKKELEFRDLNGIDQENTSEMLVGYIGNPPWSMQCHDLHHSSRSPYSTSHIDGLEKWRRRGIRDGFGGVIGGPIIDNKGIIYYGDQDDYIYAIYPNGTMKWAYKTYMWILSAPALAEDGTLYVTSWDTRLYALNSTTGKLKWKLGALGGVISGSPAIGTDGTIYFGTVRDFDKGDIIAVNPNGTIKWYYEAGNRIYSDPAIGDDGTIYIGSDDGYLYAMNPNGTLKWRYKTGHHIKAPPSIAADGTIYVPSYDDYLYAFYPNGILKWKCDGVGAATNPAIGEDGTIYLSNYDTFHAVYPNGNLKWTYDLGSSRHIDASSCAISSEGTIYVGVNIGSGSAGELLALNPDGTIKWSKKLSDESCDSSPCIGEDGTVYIGSKGNTGGYLHAFGPVESNSPPEKPKITGKSLIDRRIEYEYRFVANDPDNNPISFYIDWGDGKDSGWTLERASGEKCYYEHEWWRKGNYTIRCKAKDVMGEESDWAYLSITVPHSYNNPFWWLNGLLDRFPLLLRLFDFIMN